MATIKYSGIVGQLQNDGRVQCALPNAAGGICGSIIKNERKNLRDHVNQHHRAGSSYKRRNIAQPGVSYYCTCTMPNRTFSTFGGLDHHMRYTHDFRGPSGHIQNDPMRTAFVTDNRVTNRVPGVSSDSHGNNNDHAHAHEEEHEEEEEEN